MPLVRMKAAPVKTDGERLGNEFMNGVFFSTHLGLGFKGLEVGGSGLKGFGVIQGLGVQGFQG